MNSTKYIYFLITIPSERNQILYFISIKILSSDADTLFGSLLRARSRDHFHETFKLKLKFTFELNKKIHNTEISQLLKTATSLPLVEY